MHILEHLFCNGTGENNIHCICTLYIQCILFSPVRIKFSFSYLSIAFYCGQKLATKNRFYDRKSV